MATISNIQCPWKKFYKQAIKCMNSLHLEACKPQMKIARFMYAVKHNFASTTMNLTSTKQLQGSKKSKIMAQDTSNSDTDSAYNTESECNYTKHLPRPPCSSKATRQHLRPCPNKNQQLINTKCIQKTKPSCIPIPTKSNSKTSHTSTSTHLPKPSTSTRPDTQTTVRQPTVPATKTPTISTYPQHTRKAPLLLTQPKVQPTICSLPRPSEETILKQPMQTHPEPTPITKSPLLPTQPVQIKHTDIPRLSAFYNREPTSSGPSPVNNHRFHQQHRISRPYTTRYNTFPTFSGPANYRYYPQPHIPRPPYQHQDFIPRPYQQHQQPQGHRTQQVSLPPYVPIIILTPYNQINNVLAQQTKLFNPNQQ